MAIFPIYKEGQIEDEEYHSQLNQSLQNNFSDNGLSVPSQPVATITDLSTSGIPGTGKSAIWYDSDNDRWIGNQNGTLVTFTTVPI